MGARLLRRGLLVLARGLLSTAIAAAALLLGLEARAIPAFPGAEGFGAETPAGRGGVVIPVTNLLDLGVGSLRDALGRDLGDPETPRIVVFRVGGTILVDSALEVTWPYTTIAGQTAPGGGIAVRRSGAEPRCSAQQQACFTPTLAIRTHDVVVRYLRLRPGRASSRALDDALLVDGGAHDVVIDHCSLSWATDENLDIGGEAGAHDVTVQWSILSEGLGDPECSSGAESIASWKCSRGALVGNGGPAADPVPGSGNVTLHHNLIAHHFERHPKLSGDLPIDMVNNLIYNAAGSAVTMLADDKSTQEAHLNYVANYVIQRLGVAPWANQELVERFRVNPSGPGVLAYVLGNIGPNRPSTQWPEDAQVRCQTGAESPCTPRLSSVRFPAPPVTTTLPVSGTAPAAALLALVLERAGANGQLSKYGALVSRRDRVDTCVVNTVWLSNVQPGEVTSATTPPGEHDGNGIITDPAGGCGPWPALDNGPAPADPDGDAMPTAWENLFGFDPNDAGDQNQDADGDGYTNVEEYLNATDPRDCPGAGDQDGDAVGDACDNCPALANSSQADRDSDGIGNACDPEALVLASIGAEDGWIRESGEQTNTGGAFVSIASAQPIRIGDHSADQQYVSVLSFDTSGVPDGAAVVAATLALRRSGLAGTNPYATFAPAWVDVRTGWFGSTSALALHDFGASATAAQAGVLTDEGATARASLGASGLAAVHTGGLTQLRIRFARDDDDDLGIDYVAYYSGENATPAYRPTLTVQYVLP